MECILLSYKDNYWNKVKIIKSFLNKDNLAHKEDSPAIEYEDGTKAWYINGKRHRSDGPALEYPNGDAEWWVDGNLHRENGPARDWRNCKQYYLNGVLFTEENFWIKIRFGEFV